MKVSIVTVGTKMPDWVRIATDEYVKRLSRDLPLTFVEIPLAHRSKSQVVAKLIEKEAEAILAKIPSGSYVVALEVSGKSISTQALADKLQVCGLEGQDLCLLVGGPDGLGNACRDRADALWSLSALTLPHPLVRVILAEQLYRAHTILKGHPYHRE